VVDSDDQTGKFLGYAALSVRPAAPIRRQAACEAEEN
jgi:hypothetical protein